MILQNIIPDTIRVVQQVGNGGGVGTPLFTITLGALGLNAATLLSFVMKAGRLVEKQEQQEKRLDRLQTSHDQLDSKITSLQVQIADLNSLAAHIGRRRTDHKDDAIGDD